MRHLILATLFVALTNGFFTLKVDFISVSSATLLLTVLSETIFGFNLADTSVDVVDLSLFILSIILSSSAAVVLRGLPDPFLLPVAPVLACTLIILYAVDLGSPRALAILFPEYPAHFNRTTASFTSSDTCEVPFFTPPVFLGLLLGPLFLFRPISLLQAPLLARVNCL